MRILKLKPKGDTLIEVLFAFVILSSIISIAFSGALNSYKSAVSAQNRTQALFLAQYQADALKTYRDSLDWDNTNGQQSFLNGGVGSIATDLIGLSTAGYTTDPNKVFCMKKSTSSPNYWTINTNNSGDCNNLAKELAPNLQSPTLSITLASGSVANSYTATIRVTWVSSNNQTENVTNRIILAKD